MFKAKLSASTTVLIPIPTVRLVESPEQCDGRFDATLTSDFGRATLLELRFLLARLKPQFKLNRLLYKSCAEWHDTLTTTSCRRRGNFAEVLDHIREDPTPERISRLASRIGFCKEWTKSTKRGKALGRLPSRARGNSHCRKYCPLC